MTDQKTIELMTEGDLKRYRADIIEECARVAETTAGVGVDCAAAIRALKDKP